MTRNQFLTPLMTRNQKPVLISFSGIDGAGKSTQIGRLRKRLEDSGAKVLMLAFWDNVVFLPRFRAGVSHRVLGGEIGVGSPGKPVRRNDKNERRWYLSLARCALYLSDVINLRRVVARAKLSDADIIIFDRYIYDQLANAPTNWLGRAYVRFLLKLAPKPAIGYLLDADPEAALKRKPEYPLDFLRRYRKAYFDLCAFSSEIATIPPGSIEAVENKIAQLLASRCGVHEARSVSSEETNVERLQA
jgi:thymidylate kinase